jgi:hypothetical protein
MNLSPEYEQDFQQWIEYQITLLRERKWPEVDIDHLIEELEDMGNSNKTELESRFRVLLTHLLKWQFQYRQLSGQWKTFTGGSWKGSIREQRKGIMKKLKQNLSLKRYLLETIQSAYPDAVDIASDETGLPLVTFPKHCPYTIEQLLDDQFFPES